MSQLEQTNHQLVTERSHAKVESSNCAEERRKLETALGETKRELDKTARQINVLRQELQEIELQSSKLLAAVNKTADAEVKARAGEAKMKAQSRSTINQKDETITAQQHRILALAKEKESDPARMQNPTDQLAGHARRLEDYKEADHSKDAEIVKLTEEILRLQWEKDELKNEMFDIMQNHSTPRLPQGVDFLELGRDRQLN